jgi:hypothetical protein
MIPLYIIVLGRVKTMVISALSVPSKVITFLKQVYPAVDAGKIATAGNTVSLCNSLMVSQSQNITVSISQ